MNELFDLAYRRMARAIAYFEARRHGFWFIDIPRTSSSSIRAELGRCFGRPYGKRNIMQTEHATTQVLADHVPACEMQRLLGRSLWRRLFTFTMVRNPWARTVSMYHYRRKRKGIPTDWSFGDYVHVLKKAGPETPYFEYYGFRYGQAEYVVDEKGALLVDFVARYERRAQDLRLVAERIGCSQLGRLMLQQADPVHRHYSEYYNVELRDAVGELYCKDLEMFGYRFEVRRPESVSFPHA